MCEFTKFLANKQGLADTEKAAGVDKDKKKNPGTQFMNAWASEQNRHRFVRNLFFLLGSSDVFMNLVKVNPENKDIKAFMNPTPFKISLASILAHGGNGQLDWFIILASAALRFLAFGILQKMKSTKRKCMSNSMEFWKKDLLLHILLIIILKKIV